MKFDDYLRLQDCKESTIIAYEIAVKQLLEYTGKEPEELNQNDVDEFKLHVKKKYAHNTQLNKLSGVKWYMRYLKKDIEIKIPKFIPTMKSALTEQEIEELLKASDSNITTNAIINTLYYTAIRKSELIGLELTDIDLNKDILHINRAKRDKSRDVFLSPECKKSIQRYLTIRLEPVEGNPLFVSTHRKRFTAGGIDYLVRTTAVKAGITKKVHPHILRASLITHMHNRGASIKEIQAISGHTQLDTLLHYVKLDESNLRKGYLKSIPTFGSKPKPDTITPKPKLPEPKQETNISRDDEIIQLFKDGYLEKNDFMALMGIKQTDIVGYV